jgi:hypothetical protein
LVFVSGLVIADILLWWIWHGGAQPQTGPGGQLSGNEFRVLDFRMVPIAVFGRCSIQGLQRQLKQSLVEMPH